ncbi:TIGR03016 family PEP-CTERM system-associated outer membrane protein [Oleiphilus messinensis]|nr:TIGR03016 family PEP-CTERM system-associated outer membrane protein [Oleiphilus messinensis]
MKGVTALSILGILSHVATVNGKPRVTPSLGFSEEYTDNVNLSENDEEDSFITEITPTITIADTRPSSDYRLSYSYRYIDFTASEVDSRSENTLDARLNHYAMDRTLRTYLESNINNSRASLLQSSNNDGKSGAERVETRTAAGGFDYSTGQRAWTEFDLGFEVRKTKSDNDSVNLSTYSADLVFQEGKRVQMFDWEFSTGYATDSEDNEYNNTNGRLSFVVTQNFSVFAQGQYEESVALGDDENEILATTWGVGTRYDFSRSHVSLAYNKFEKGDGNDFISAGLGWNPSARTSVAANLTERFFGESYQLNVTHRARYFRNSIQYLDEVTNLSQLIFQRQTGALLCPEGNDFSLADCVLASAETPLEPGQQLITVEVPVSAIGEDQVLSRRLGLTSNYSKGKSTFTGNLFWVRTKRLTDDDFASKDYDKELGANISWVWKFSGKTNLNFIADLRKVESNQDTSTKVQANEYLYRARLTRQFTQKISASLIYSHSQRHSDLADDDYIENHLALSALARF